MEILSVLKNSPIPIILVLTGIVFLFLPSAAQNVWKIKLPGRQQKTSIAVGLGLLFLGLSIYLIPAVGASLGANNPPTIMGVTIRASREAGELVYYQEINFYDEDGNTNIVERKLVDLSDQSQRQYIQIQDGVVDDSPQIQKIRSATTETWHCEGRIYVATLEVSLLDKDGNRSKPVRYSIDCK
jgi:hypothetical protein